MSKIKHDEIKSAYLKLCNLGFMGPPANLDAYKAYVGEIKGIYIEVKPYMKSYRKMKKGGMTPEEFKSAPFLTEYMRDWLEAEGIADYPTPGLELDKRVKRAVGIHRQIQLLLELELAEM